MTDSGNETPRSLKRKVLSMLVGVSITAGVIIGTHIWIMDRANGQARQMEPVLTEIMEARDDQNAIANLTESPAHNQFAITWIIHIAHNSKSRDLGAMKEAVVKGAYHTNEYELRTFLESAHEYVNAPTPEQRETYAQVGALDSIITLDLPKAFRSAWNECRENLNEQYDSAFIRLKLMLDLAFPESKPACPVLNNEAMKLTNI